MERETMMVLSLTGLILLIVISFLVIGCWLLIRTNYSGHRKLFWHKLIGECYFVSLIDDDGMKWELDIYYNRSISKPTSKLINENLVKLYIPKGFKRADFVCFVRKLKGIDEKFVTLINALISSDISTLKFNEEDTANFKDLKVTLMAKTLKG